jgi:parallel beta-helix repeat protein
MKNPLILSIILMSLLLASNVQSATLTVCGSGCNSTTIQGAINSAGSGDTVEVNAGTYNESVIIDKSLNLLGAKANVDSRGGAWGSVNISVINAGEGNNGILINESNVTVNGFKIIESGSDAEVFSFDYPFESAIYVYNENTELENIVIIYNWIDNNHGSGIIVRYAKEPIIEYNYISNNGDGVWAAAGIGGQELTNGSFSYNEIYNSISYGIYFGGGKVGSIPKNISGTLISHNDFHDNEKYGLQLYGYYEPVSVSNSGIRLEYNNFRDNGRCGIKITDFTDTIIENNSFSNNGANGTSDKYRYGALVSAYYTANGTRFINNNFSDNEIGGIYFLLELEGASLYDITAYHNNFLDNGFGVITATRGAFDFPFMINAENNWWGTISPNSSRVYGNVTYYPFCISAGCAINIEDVASDFTGGNTTNFSAISNWSAVDLYLESDNGDINWTLPIDLTGSNMMFNYNIEITPRSISVDSSEMPELDSPAILTFKNSGFSSTTQFDIYRNGAKCPKTICTKAYMINGNVVIETTKLSYFTLSPKDPFLSMTSNLIAIILAGGGIFTFLGLVFVPKKLLDIKSLIYAMVFIIIVISLIATI